MSDPADRPLEPARPEPDEPGARPSYMPRVPWRWVLLFGGLLATVVGFYQVRQHQRADALRAEILASHDRNLRSLSERYVAFRQRIERWVVDAAQAGEPERWVDPRLAISGLHSGDGLYLRLTVDQARSVEAVRQGALGMGEDSLTRCLGLAPASARGLYATGEFLTPEWLEEVRSATDLMRLRVLDEQLARNMEVDVPVLATLLRSQYFLLVIQQGDNRRDAPVDVYLWDLGEDRQLLRARFQARGILIPVRLRFDGVPSAPPTHPPLFSGGAHDCSIAAQIKALTGEAPMEIGSGSALETELGEPEAAETAAPTPSEPGAPGAQPPEVPAP